MLGRVCNHLVVRKSLQRAVGQSSRAPTTVRHMGGGGKFLHVDQTDTNWGIFFGTICWLWIFHRARHDLPVVYGFRHPWEHAPGDDHGSHGGHDSHGHEGSHEKEEGWDNFTKKAINVNEDDEDDDEDDDEE
eukprot:CAMPEP_0168744126 /NCGR_PEP_ID=MMETSP0724-20121128/13930_1 /TAXON_ID=265536 /ORGANISM="Amphiprora sp., Strain CCMP467" /LENGTH=131 /DNA_ID=CAMNT_0008791775 /DNA_START=51 /DNA_END=446 /DNA_ORIENTATION=+